jgi:hypothetical protein
MRWFSGAAAEPPGSEKYYLVNWVNETPFGYYLHREKGTKYSYFVDEARKKRDETFNKYVSQSTIDDFNDKNPGNPLYEYVIEPPRDKYNFFKMTGDPDIDHIPHITYIELLKHYGVSSERPGSKRPRSKSKHHGHGGKVRKSRQMGRKSRQMGRKSRKGKKRIFTH